MNRRRRRPDGTSLQRNRQSPVETSRWDVSRCFLPRRMVLVGIVATVIGCRNPAMNRSDDAMPTAVRPHGPLRAGRPNLPFPTLGGMQFWADLWVHAGWRIQENAVSGHCRLLDPSDVRLAWGSFDECRAAFDEMKERRPIRTPAPRRVLLLHGLGRTRRSMETLAAALREAGFEADTVAYASTRRGLAEHADRLGRLLDGLEGAEEVSFVTHSLGALVVRTALARGGAWTSRLRLGRVVMVTPPNRGSVLAERFGGFPPYQWVAGPSGQEVAPAGVCDLPPPPCRFGIVAGTSRGEGNPLIPGPDDGIVGVEETRLDGAEDFLLLDAGHAFMMEKPEVVLAVKSFLSTGRFRADRP